MQRDLFRSNICIKKAMYNHHAPQSHKVPKIRSQSIFTPCNMNKNPYKSLIHLLTVSNPFSQPQAHEHTPPNKQPPK